MIEFVDLKTGKLFHIDSGAPYTFWFENGQSTNLNYVRKICFIADKARIRVELDSPVFTILKLDQNIPIFNKQESEVINAKRYLDIEKLKATRYDMTGWKYTPGNATKPVFVYMLYILGSSKDAGEIRDNFTIDGNVYEVGADFYSSNEILKSNLENFDINIPESIQKAIYEVNVHEESNDNITLNRKYKELLMNYWDIVANKGSYNSLLNSLAWFEWGDLVRIEEVWKRHHRNNEIDFFHTELNRQLDDEFEAQLTNNAKTTYIGLYMALSKLTQDKDGNWEYQDTIGGGAPITGRNTATAVHNTLQSDRDAMASLGWIPASVQINPQVGEHEFDSASITERISQPSGDNRDVMVYNEPMPNLELVTTKWNLLELCLKMTLLGNFFSTYFMPIHMDLVHSTVEHWVFAVAYKYLHTTGIERIDTINRGSSFKLVWDTSAKIRHINNHIYSHTLFKGNQDVFGVNLTHDELEQVNNPLSFNPLRYFFGGAAGVINFRAFIPALDENDYITKQRLTWYSDNGSYGTIDNKADGVFDEWFDVLMKPTQWFVKDKYPTYEPNRWVCLEPGTFERILIEPQEVVHPDDHHCQLPEGTYATPVSQTILNHHDWIRLGTFNNWLWEVAPNDVECPIPGGDAEHQRELEGNYKSYPNEDTYSLGWYHNFEFNIGFRKAGHYVVSLEFTTISGQVYNRSVEVDIVDDITNDVKFYKVTGLPQDIRNSIGKDIPAGDVTPWLHCFQMQQKLDEMTPESHLETQVQIVNGMLHEFTVYKGYTDHSIFIAHGQDVRLNHTVIFSVPLNDAVSIRVGDEVSTYSTNNLLDSLRQDLAQYIWIENQVDDAIRYVGISRWFTDEQHSSQITDIAPSQSSNASKWTPLYDSISHSYVPILRDSFHPFMHTLTNIDLTEEVPHGTLIYVEPALKFSAAIDECNWIFENRSTNTQYDSLLFQRNHYAEGGSYGDHGTPRVGGMQSTLISPYTEMEMKPGYYSLEVHYSKGGNHQVHRVDSAFLLSKQ